MKVFVPAFQPYQYLDITVVCGKPIIEKIGGMEALTNPQMIIEILSPSTEAFDRRKKFTLYKSNPSFPEYLLIAPDQPSITYYSKQGNDWVLAEAEGVDATLQIPAFNSAMNLSEIYLDVEFLDGQPDLFLVGDDPQ